jgi:hypothetical protein
MIVRVGVNNLTVYYALSLVERERVKEEREIGFPCRTTTERGS